MPRLVKTTCWMDVLDRSVLNYAVAFLITSAFIKMTQTDVFIYFIFNNFLWLKKTILCFIVLMFNVFVNVDFEYRVSKPEMISLARTLEITTLNISTVIFFIRDPSSVCFSKSQDQFRYLFRYLLQCLACSRRLEYLQLEMLQMFEFTRRLTHDKCRIFYAWIRFGLSPMFSNDLY